MASAHEIPDEIRRYLAVLIEEDLDKNRDHLKWLAGNPDEPDREQQRAESDRAIELGRKAAAYFPVSTEEPADSEASLSYGAFHESMLAALSVGCLTVIVEQLDTYGADLSHLEGDAKDRERAKVDASLAKLKTIRADMAD